MEDALRQALTLGRGFYSNKEYAKAEPYLAKVAAEETGFADVHNMLGVIYHDRGQFEKAQRCFEKAVQINPNYTEAALNLAVTYNDQGKYLEAKEVYRGALHAVAQSQCVLDPFVAGKISNMYAEIGDVYVSCGAFREALTEYQRALTLRPTFVDIRLKLANAYRDLGDRPSALREFDACLAQSPDFVPALLHRGITRYAMNDIDGAVADLERVLQIEPAHARAQLYLSMVRDRQDASTRVGAGGPGEPGP
ncbi:MAG: tetratricopeptide repeat protein [Deltaproteobacteria bacterium]|nr:tetratricopeptide repeat protein [Deltaproteobacteria bacterium]